MAKQSKFEIKLSMDTQEYKRNLRSAKRQLENTFGGSWVYVSKRAEKVAQGFAAIGTAITVMSVKAFGAFEKQKESLVHLMGSLDAANKKIKSLRDFAAKTPFTFNELLDYEKRLLALGFTADQTEAVLTSLGDAAAGLDMGAFGLERLIKAVTDIKAKGVLQTQEMRQLAEAGIPAWEMLAKAIGVSIPEAMKLVEQRAVSSGQALIAIFDGINKRFSGMMEKQAKTIAGHGNNILGEIKSIAASFGEYVVEKTDLNNKMEQLLDYVRQLRTEIDAIGFSEAFQGLMSGKIGEAIKSIGTFITLSLIPAFGNLLLVAKTSWRIIAVLLALGGLTYVIRDIMRNQEEYILAVDQLAASLPKALKLAWEHLKYDLPYLAEEITVAVIEKVARMAASLVASLAKKLDSFFDYVKKNTGVFINFLVEKFGDAISWIGFGLKKVKFLKEFGRSLEELGQEIGNSKAVGNFVEDVLNGLRGGFNELFPPLLDEGLESLSNKIVHWAKQSKEKIKQARKELAQTISAKAKEQGFMVSQGAFLSDEEIQKYEKIIDLKKRLGYETYTRLMPDGIFGKQSIEKVWKLYMKPPLQNFAEPYIQGFQKIFKLDPASRLRRQLEQSGLADAAAAKAAELKKAATGLSAEIEHRWIWQTKTKLEQLEIEYAAEKDKLEKLKDSNENYYRDLQRLADIYEPQIAAEMSGENGLYRTQEILTEEYAAHEAHIRGLRELYDTKASFMMEAARSASSYMAEVYNYMYDSVSQGITDLIVTGRSFGDILKNIGNELIAMVVRWTVQRKMAAALSKKLSAAEAGQSAILAKTTAAAWADAAALVSLATFGANAAAASVGMASVAGMAKGMAFLADGGVITKPTIAMIGEGGEPEAVIPLSRFKEMKGGDVAVNVYNNTPAEVKTNTSFDGTKTIIDFFIDGYSRNVNGVRDIVRSY